MFSTSGRQPLNILMKLMRYKVQIEQCLNVRAEDVVCRGIELLRLYKPAQGESSRGNMENRIINGRQVRCTRDIRS